jgi:RNA polymerase sigma factor (sigma-70 family)
LSTRTDFEYLAPAAFDLLDEGFAFEEVDWEAGTGGARAELSDDLSRSDIGYFMEIAGRYALLDAQEERTLGATLWRERARLLRLLRGSSLEPYLGIRPATPSTRRRLARVERLARDIAEKKSSRKGASPRRLARSLAELDRARHRLVEHNLRLVVWVAKRFRGRGFDFIDLIQEGCLGLMRAVERFDPRVGARFSTFATHWIQQGIRRALAEKARSIRIPVNRTTEVRQIVSTRSLLSAALGRPVLASEIAEGSGLPVAAVEELLPAIASIESIDAQIPATDKLLSDTLKGRGPSPLDDAIDAEIRNAVKEVLDQLPLRQRTILEMRYGIDYPRESTLDEIGERLGLSRERIRQVEKVAAAAVRDWIRRNRGDLARPV